MSWSETVRRVRQRYVDGRSVLAAARGTRIVGGEVTEEDAVVFLVARKVKAPRRPLPRYVHDVRGDGSVDRSKRYVTDVREMRNARALSSGRRLERRLASGPGPIEAGTVSLAFVAGNPARVMVLSCSHVMADAWGQREPQHFVIGGPANGRRRWAGRVDCHTKIVARRRRLVLSFDAAIGTVLANASSVPRWSIPRARRVFRGLYPGPIRSRMGLSILGAATGTIGAGQVSLLRFVAPLSYRRGAQEHSVLVSNLYGLDGFVPVDGDSGGIVYRNDEAVGLVVGDFFDSRRQRYTTVFHRISSAASHVAGLAGGALAAHVLDPIG